MNIPFLRLSLAVSLLSLLAAPAAQAQESCVSSNPVIAAMQVQWNNGRIDTGNAAFTDGFAPVTLTLALQADAGTSSPKPVFQSKKKIRYASRYRWRVQTEGDYWIAADSAAWIDVIDGAQTLEPLTFNHGLRCAGIHKALKFHLHAAVYSLLIGSEDKDKVKISAGLDTPAE